MKQQQQEQLRQAIAERAEGLGFEAVSFVSAEKLPTERAYQEWL